MRVRKANELAIVFGLVIGHQAGKGQKQAIAAVAYSSYADALREIAC